MKFWTQQRMNRTLRFILLFAVSIVGAGCVHELGHAVASWVQGVGAVPTPLKEYVLRDEIEWSQYVWIALGGVVGSVLTVVVAVIWFLRRPGGWGEPVLAGALLTPLAYTLRFLLMGRGHDSLEWQAAQTAFGADPAGHAVDLIFLVLCLVGGVVWVVRRRDPLTASSLGKVTGLAFIGIALLIMLQVGNNALFDRWFAESRTVNVPPALQALQDEK
jgi:hypothetical protein